jgi:ATP-binding cassette subfamily B protein/subfamily B ATP-binding cassette protein MsbA
VDRLNSIHKERKDIINGIENITHRYKKEFILIIVLQSFFVVIGIVGPLLYGILIDEVIIGRKVEALFIVCIGYILTYIFETVLILCKNSVSNTVFTKIKLQLRKNIWKQYMKAPFLYYENHRSGDLKERMDADVNAFETFIDEQMISLLYYRISAVIYFVVLLLLSWKLALFSFTMIPLANWMTKRMSKGSAQAWGAYRKDYGSYESWLQQNLTNWKEVKSLNAVEQQGQMFSTHWEVLKTHFYKGCLYWYINRSFINFSNTFITKMNLYFIGGLLIFSGDMRMGALFVFMKYYEQFFEHVNNINGAGINLQKYKKSLHNVLNVISENFVDNGKHNCDLNGEIIFDNVSFKYANNSEEALHSISTKINTNECTAIVGKSGSGKSTLIKVLLSMYPLQSGQILFNDCNLSDINKKALYRHIGTVMQDSILFNMTIEENLRLANQKASIKQIQQACQKAYILEDILHMPQGFSSLIGEKGIQLSGGQKQRIAIARVLLADPRIIIFDEATSALDGESEKMIRKFIMDNKERKTIIVIAHRWSSVLAADKIIVMNAGKVEAEGTTEELKQHNKVFNELFRGQYCMD